MFVGLVFSCERGREGGRYTVLRLLQNSGRKLSDSCDTLSRTVRDKRSKAKHYEKKKHSLMSVFHKHTTLLE